MTEYEVLDLILERRQEVISMVQWWASISVGLIAASQLLERHLNIVLLSVLNLFYLFYTYVVYRYIGSLFSQILASFEDLAKIENPSTQAIAMLGALNSGVVGGNANFALWAMAFVALVTCSYPVWVYVSARTDT